MTDQLETKGNEVKVSQYFTLRFGTMNARKGPLVTQDERDGMIIYSWDYVDRCWWNLCVAHRVCHYYDGGPDPLNGSCKVMFHFLKGVALTLFDFKEMSKLDLWRVGMHLMPMYRTYVKLLIAEAGHADAMYQTSKGEWRVNPVHKAIIDVADKISREVTKLEKGGLIGPGARMPPGTVDLDFGQVKPIVRRKKDIMTSKKDLNKAKARLRTRRSREPRLPIG